MKSSPLAMHLGVVIAVKLLLLGCLWLVFVRGDTVPVGPAAMAARAGVSALDFQFPGREDRE